MSDYIDLSENTLGSVFSPIDSGQPDDLLVVSASYEKRCLSMVTRLRDDYKCRFSLIHVTKEFIDAGPSGWTTKDNLEVLRNEISKHCRNEPHVIMGSWLSVKHEFEAIQRAIAAAQECLGGVIERLTFDVTTLTRESLLMLLAALSQQFGNPRTRIVYTKPCDYGEWLSRGFRRVRNVVGFPGVHIASKQTALIILSGFEEGRAVKVIDEIEPTCVLWGMGDPPTDPKFLQRNEMTSRVILSRQDVENFRFPANSVCDCTCKIVSEIDRATEKWGNVILVPMSTKLSTVAAFRAVMARLEVQLAYGLPGEYNTSEYSRDESGIYVETLSSLIPST